MMKQRRFLLLREWLYRNAAFEKVSVVRKKRKRFFVWGYVLVLGRSGSSACVFGRALGSILRMRGLCDWVFKRSNQNEVEERTKVT